MNGIRLVILLLFFQNVHANRLTEEEQIRERHFAKLCAPADEYIETVKFLRNLEFVRVSEKNIRQVADIVSSSCNGASERFQKTFSLLKKMGVTYTKSLELALEFAKEKDDVQENFFEVLKLAYVAEMFDLDFKMALDVAYQFSIHLKSHHEQARKDFIDLAKHCRNDKELGLPQRTCAQIAIRIAHMSPYFPGGVYSHFKKLLKKLRTGEQFGLSVRSAMETLVVVLKHGPRASESFIKGYDFALDDKGLQMKAEEALKFALTMAKRSSPTDPPPIVSTAVIE